MDRFDRTKLFLRVVEAGSFSKAARLTGIAQSTASKQIAALEKRIGVQLVRRTSCGLALTAAGQHYYDDALRLLDAFEALEDAVGDRDRSPTGLVRLTCPPGFVTSYILPRLEPFVAQYPGLSLEIVVSQHLVNLVEERINVAIRVGDLEDSELRSRQLGTTTAIVVASADYLRVHGTPKTPSELEGRPCIASVHLNKPRPWHFRRGATRTTPARTLRRLPDRFARLLPDALLLLVARLGIAATFFTSGRTKVERLLTIRDEIPLNSSSHLIDRRHRAQFCGQWPARKLLLHVCGIPQKARENDRTLAHVVRIEMVISVKRSVMHAAIVTPILDKLITWHAHILHGVIVGSALSENCDGRCSHRCERFEPFTKDWDCGHVVVRKYPANLPRTIVQVEIDRHLMPARQGPDRPAIPPAQIFSLARQ